MAATRTRDVLRSVAVPLVLVLVWEGLSRAGLINPMLLPSPWHVLLRWVRYLRAGELLRDAASSLYRVLVGFLIGTALALPLGLAMGASKSAYAFLNPVLQVLRPIPPIAYIPLAILWFGLGNPPAFFLISLGAFFPVLMNTIAGVRSVDAV
jgi:NitT/TauT family transport system permease protein